ncbi:threonine/homoserine/homoserine lactone efflux protein [Paraburkholderia sp. BL23I1N1]|uniref:LysE family translocator n=1 Tax=Paraburkholderia sp. BL23I1N1 TaxID=1938802 RepID=UPI000E71BB41|nr:LysE family translocator [Paraburkholderia sp. BL23I1N1]RKE39917.1 threonine/homoserine/homoserine lactone efflux protein [Paraburkholderia sp. BL23I1N1]
MISWNIWILFFGYTVPMVVSPGPGNTVLATAGGRFGVAGSIPFWAGFETANVALCLIYGMGLGKALHGHPEFQMVLKWAGTAYLLYLAWGFFRSSAESANSSEEGSVRLRAGDGFLSVILNPKIHSMILVMFSQFLDPAQALPAQVFQLAVAFLVVCVACHLPWIVGGRLILRRFRSARAMRIQGWVFGLCMILVAAYVAFG